MNKHSVIIPGSDEQPIAIDFYFKHGFIKAPLVIYAHGFCGFKDWGDISLVAQEFVDAGLAFACFNFSHNGTSLDAPEQFVHLDLFAGNNFTKQLFDFKEVLKYFGETNNDWRKNYDKKQMGIIGHSMGGGMALITALENQLVNALSTWASVINCDTPFGSWDDKKMEDWKIKGTACYHNGRTKQDLPMNYQLVEDAMENETRLNIKERIIKLEIPVLICHGTEDSSVPFSSAEFLKKNIKDSQLLSVASDHVFGRKHPAENNDLPPSMKTVVKATVEFFLENLK